MTNIYQFEAELLDGKSKPLADYEGKVLLIVNTASKCGFTPQFSGLEKLYEKYKDQGLEILGFPCNQFGGQDPGSNEQIGEFCQKNYGVSFPMFSKVDVKGPEAHAIFRYLTNNSKGILGNGIKWNFTKFLIGRDGKVLNRFAPTTKPEDIEDEIRLYKDETQRVTSEINRLQNDIEQQGVLRNAAEQDRFAVEEELSVLKQQRQ